MSPETLTAPRVVLTSRSSDPAYQPVVAAYRGGMPVTQIAAESKCTPMLVRKMLGEAGLLERRRGRPWPYSSKTEQLIASAYQAGATMAELVQLHGGSNRTIGYVLQHRGVRIRNRGRRANRGPR